MWNLSQYKEKRRISEKKMYATSSYVLAALCAVEWKEQKQKAFQPALIIAWLKQLNNEKKRL